jgi:hypothetical protein
MPAKRKAPSPKDSTANLNQSRTLATLRDTLLPKLLGGELSVAGLKSIKKHLSSDMNPPSINPHSP